MGEQSKLGVQARCRCRGGWNLRERRRPAVVAVDTVWEKQANVGTEEDALGLGKVAECRELFAKTTVSYRRYRKEYELDILRQGNQGAQS